jgi:hypothetical protein
VWAELSGEGGCGRERSADRFTPCSPETGITRPAGPGQDPSGQRWTDVATGDHSRCMHRVHFSLSTASCYDSNRLIRFVPCLLSIAAVHPFSHQRRDTHHTGHGCVSAFTPRRPVPALFTSSLGATGVIQPACASPPFPDLPPNNIPRQHHDRLSNSSASAPSQSRISRRDTPPVLRVLTFGAGFPASSPLHQHRARFPTSPPHLWTTTAKPRSSYASCIRSKRQDEGIKRCFAHYRCSRLAYRTKIVPIAPVI